MLQEALRRVEAIDSRLSVLEADKFVQATKWSGGRVEIDETPMEGKEPLARLKELKEGDNYLEYVDRFAELADEKQVVSETILTIPVQSYDLGSDADITVFARG